MAQAWVTGETGQRGHLVSGECLRGGAVASAALDRGTTEVECIDVVELLPQQGAEARLANRTAHLLEQRHLLLLRVFHVFSMFGIICLNDVG